MPRGRPRATVIVDASTQTEKASKNVTYSTAKGKYKKRKGYMNIMKINKTLLPKRKALVFTYSTFYSMTLPALQKSVTEFFSLTSLFDPEYSNGGRNDIYGYYNKYMGNTAGLYQSYRPYVCSFEIKAVPTTASTLTRIVYSPSNVGSSDYPTTASVYKIAERQGALVQDLEYLGDTNYKTVRFKVYINQVIGLTREQYKDDADNLLIYNSTAGPWLAISVGDATDLGNSQTVTFQIKMKLKAIVQNPVATQP